MTGRRSSVKPTVSVALHYLPTKRNHHIEMAIGYAIPNVAVSCGPNNQFCRKEKVQLGMGAVNRRRVRKGQEDPEVEG
jgi:hypothetical protein